MKVLLLTVTTGQGHNQAAKSLCDFLKSQGIENRYLDVFEYISPVIKEALSQGYIMSTKRFSKIYGKLYTLVEKNNDKERRVLKITNNIMAQKLLGLIEEYSPDIIVCTHVFSALLITALKNTIKPHIKSIGIVTDFTIHPLWEDTDIDYYITASELLSNQAEKKNIKKEKLLPIGIPIKPEFSEKMEKKKAREILELEDKRTILVMSGSMGYGKVEKVIEELDQSELDFQIISICGYNEKLHKKISKMKTRKKLINLSFTDKVNLYMDASDCIVSKPGGLTTSEALAKGVPMIMINPIPGQEERNVEFLLNNGAALRVSKTFSVDDAVYQLFSNTERLKTLKETVSFLGKPNSTADLVKFILGQKIEGKGEKL